MSALSGLWRVRYRVGTKACPGFPAVGLDLVAADLAEFRFELFDVGEQRFRIAAEIGDFFAGVAEDVQQIDGCLLEGRFRKCLDCGLNSLPLFSRHDRATVLA